MPEVIQGRGGGANRTKGASRAAGANHGQRGRIAGSGSESCKIAILPCSVMIIFLLLLEQS